MSLELRGRGEGLVLHWCWSGTSRTEVVVMLGIASHSRNRIRDVRNGCVVKLFGDWGTDGVWRVHQLVLLVQDVPVVHVCLVVPCI